MTTHSTTLAWRIPWKGSWQTMVHWVAQSDMTEATQHVCMHITCHQGNTNENNEILLNTCQNGQNPEQVTTPKAEEDADQQEHSSINGRNAK